MSKNKLLISSCLALSLIGCSPSDNASTGPENSSEAETGLSVTFEKITLDNGLDVIFHVDKSDPIVAIDLAVHVGSAREVKGRTGFAHLFEHLLFLDSENLGYGGLDAMNTRIGGDGTNGFTTNDMTQYFQAVPKDGLEKIIWAEADKLGYFIKTVNQNVIDNEKQVVKNEKRQRVDNQPYGHNFYVINKTLFPEDHPYNWQVIGSLEDLEAATLEDVKDFYKKWYVPNNVTVTIAGDFDVSEAKTMVKKYFGEIPRGETIQPYAKRPAELSETVSLYHEDNFAQVPQLTMVWPAVEEYHPDSYPLEILLQYLTDGKRAPLNEVLIDEEKLTSSVGMFNFSKEISGELYLLIRSNKGTDLDALIPAIVKGFTRFETNGISQSDLDQIKTGIEVGVYNGLQSALGKAIELGEYNIFTGDPGGLSADIKRLQSVTVEDVMRVYNQYIKDKPYVATSFVPKDALDLALSGSVKADVVEEKVVSGADAPIEFDPAARLIDEPTPSSFDRATEPPFGQSYTLPAPKVVTGNIGSLEYYGIESDEIPLVTFSLRIDAGRNRGDTTKPAIAALTADLLNKGTQSKTTADLEDALKALGSNVSISSGDTATFISGTSLNRNFAKTIALVEEMLLEPRWDVEEFDILKRNRLNQIIQSEGNPNAIASRELLKLRYPDTHMFHYTAYGTTEKLETVTLDDLKAFYAAYYAPCNAKLRIVGAIDKGSVTKAMTPLVNRWETVCPSPQEALPLEAPIEASQIYVYDIPGAKQSVVRLQRPAVPATDTDYSLLNSVNFPLGGIYTSELNTELRVNKGYTYGIRSGFSGDKARGSFGVSSSVRTNVTLESLELIEDIVSNFGATYTDEDVTALINSLIRGQALGNETLSEKLGVLGNISAYGYPTDYQARNSEKLESLTLNQLQKLVADHMVTDEMRYLVVGDAASQADRLKDLGFGDPIILNGK
ncbi:MAG: pitrilysin family protein [Maricaulaceae bacterium]